MGGIALCKHCLAEAHGRWYARSAVGGIWHRVSDDGVPVPFVALGNNLYVAAVVDGDGDLCFHRLHRQAVRHADFRAVIPDTGSIS